MADVEKQGKSVCRSCAAGLRGTEYPLREPSREPLYWHPNELVVQLDMHARPLRLGRLDK